MGVVRNPLSLNEGKHMRSDTHRGVINREAGQRGIRASEKKKRKKKGKCKSIRIVVCFETVESISINYMFIKSNSSRLQNNNSCLLLVLFFSSTE